MTFRCLGVDQAELPRSTASNVEHSELGANYCAWLIGRSTVVSTAAYRRIIAQHPRVDVLFHNLLDVVRSFRYTVVL